MKKGSNERSASSYLSANLARIERQISLGVYHRAICDELSQAGYAITLAGFRKALARARQRAENQHKSANSQIKSDLRSVKVSGRKLKADELDALVGSTANVALVDTGGRALASTPRPTDLVLTTSELQQLTALIQSFVAKRSGGQH